MEEVRQEITLVKAKIVEVEKDLREAKSVKNEGLILAVENRVAGLENRLAALQTKKNLLQEKGLKLMGSTAGIVPTVARAGILECIFHMKEVKAPSSSGDEYTILKCDDNFKLSARVSIEFPDYVLIRQSTLDIIELIQNKIATVRRFLVTGTPGVGKTVSMIVWLYYALKGELKVSYKHVIADLKTGCIILSLTGTNSWVEEWCDRNILNTREFQDNSQVLYLYDATFHKLPLILPYCSVVFSSPNLNHFKEFININRVLRMVYFTPTWQWDEIEALYIASPTLQNCAELNDIKRLFEIWGGLPRQIFDLYQYGYNALTNTIKNCHAVACIQVLEKGSFLSYGELDIKVVCSTLMQFEVVNDGTYEHAMVNFGSPFIRDGLVEASGRSFTNYCREY